MGVHDFICFIQRNGQCLHLLNAPDDNSDSGSDDNSDDGSDDDQIGAGNAIIVLIPLEHSREEILSWSLTRFRDFQSKEMKYNWDTWDFEELDGYNDLLTGDDRPWWERTIWESPTVPGYYLVNFEENAYKAFVLGELRPDQIPKGYYKEVFNNRWVDVPSTKELAYEKIIDAGKENLWDYFKSELSALTLPEDYLVLEKKIEGQDVLQQSYFYSTPTPPKLGKARFKVLVDDNLRIETLSVSSLSLSQWHQTGQSTFKIRFKVNIPSPRSLDGCLVCQERRWPGLYTCLKHQSENTEELRVRVQKQINHDAALRMSDLSNMENMQPPAIITVQFNERGEDYDMELRLL